MVGWSMRMISRLTLTQHLAEGLLCGPALLGREVGEAGVIAQVADEAAHGIRVAGEEEVDALLGEKDGALEVRGLGARLQDRSQSRGVVDRREEVGGDVQDGGHVLQRTRWLLDVRLVRRLQCHRAGMRWPRWASSQPHHSETARHRSRMISPASGVHIHSSGGSVRPTARRLSRSSSMRGWSAG